MPTDQTSVVRRTRTQAHPPRRILYLVSNPATLHGFPVGFFAEELTRPFFDFVHAGYEVEVRSPEGGPVHFDGFSDPEDPQTAYPNDLVTIGFSHHQTFGALLEDTRSIDDVDVASYDAVCVAGGGGPLLTFEHDLRLQRLIADFYEHDKVVGLICHGSCLLLWVTLSDGTLLADGKTWTGHFRFHRGASTSYNSVEEVSPGTLLVVYDRRALAPDGNNQAGIVGTFFTVKRR